MIFLKYQALLRNAAAKKLKEETEASMAVRRKTIDQRCGQPKKLEGLSESKPYQILFQSQLD